MKLMHIVLFPLTWQEIEAPEGAKFIGVAFEKGNPGVLAIVNEEAGSVRYPIAVRETNAPLPHDPGEYLGSLTSPDLSCSMHVFLCQRGARWEQPVDGASPWQN